MSLPEKHFKETKSLLDKIPSNTIAKWLLKEGYYPEQYVVPPSFIVGEFNLNPNPFYSVSTTSNGDEFSPEKFDIRTISFPKSTLTDRSFGAIHPKIYHDLVYYICKEWSLVIDHIFNSKTKIYSYSFPIPVSSRNEGGLSSLRSGRMIYEFLEMAENDLVAEGYQYKYLLKTDIKNFYPSIYTHSIAWALHTKKIVRKSGNRTAFSRFLGLKLDKLCQYANDGCTNGIPIGPAISDVIAEILLSAVDRDCSEILVKENLDFVGVRYKDDYRFLCNSREDANKIIKCLQRVMKQYNLFLNENKSDVKELPEGLFREWTAEYQQYSLRYARKIKYRRFEKSLRGTLQVDQNHQGTGVIDRFLSELSTSKFRVKLDMSKRELLKSFSLLLMLKERRPKSFPQILAIIEKLILDNEQDQEIKDHVNNALKLLIEKYLKNIEEHQYDLLWLSYFIKSHNLFTFCIPKNVQNKFIKSIRNNSNELFRGIPTDIKIFTTIKGVGKNPDLMKHLAVFNREKENEEKENTAANNG
ncbi:RNA-directed DNA polymerase [Phaeodactylibacter xiamenensis]|uniref:RNA-directed DNA polymerase n=1 Tax=Phaeodactylibacter xiamenensis TaxID=1524460 RepID=UPI003CCBEBD6